VPEGPHGLPPNESHASSYGANTVDHHGVHHDQDQSTGGGIGTHSRDTQTGIQAPHEHAHNLLVGTRHYNSVLPVHVHAGNLGSDSMGYDGYQDVAISVAEYTQEQEQEQASHSGQDTLQVNKQLSSCAERVMSNSVSMCYDSEFATGFGSNGHLQQAATQQLDASVTVPDGRSAAVLPRTCHDSSSSHQKAEPDSQRRWPCSMDTNNSSSLYTGALSSHTSSGKFRLTEDGLSGVFRCRSAENMHVDVNSQTASADADRHAVAAATVIGQNSTDNPRQNSTDNPVHTDALLGCAVIIAAPDTPRADTSPSHLPVLFVPLPLQLELDVHRMQSQWCAAPLHA
jgi:hypothetical protein